MYGKNKMTTYVKAIEFRNIITTTALELFVSYIIIFQQHGNLPHEPKDV